MFTGISIEFSFQNFAIINIKILVKDRFYFDFCTFVNVNMQKNQLSKNKITEIRGGATGGLGRTVPLLCIKVIFVNRLKPLRENIGGMWWGGDDVTNHT